MWTRRSSSLFQHINTSLNPEANPGLWDYRLRQTRPLSRNPFEPENTSSRGSYDLTAHDSPPATPTRRQSSKYEDDRKIDHYDADEKIRPESIFSSIKNLDEDWGDQVPGWLNLFFDLAWTATFSSLTSNAKFRNPWDSVSYAAFFTTAWWLWVSQVFYNVEFYTNDWLHVVFTFLQLLLFGALAATTQGFDITDYILHSPGADNLETYDIKTITPERYGAEVLTKISTQVIMLAISISRVVLLIQHLRVAIYARVTSTAKRLPLRLLIVPLSLMISVALFFVAFQVTRSAYGQTPEGAKVKVILWSVAILVEMIAHVVRFQLESSEGTGLKLRSHTSITGRLNDITTIILGEGINAIASTFYAIVKAPGFSNPTATGIFSSAMIVFFLAYLYFNGAAPLKAVRRRVAWVMMHLPWLLSVILLLEGVKNQLVLQSFLVSRAYMHFQIAKLTVMSASSDQLNSTMRPILLQAGMSYNDEYAAYMHMLQSNATLDDTYITKNTSEMADEIWSVWYLRLHMKGVLNMYITFMNNDSIPDTTQAKIQRYLYDYSYTVGDYRSNVRVSGEVPIVYQVVNELVKPSLDNARYIMAMCGATFISLASLNLIQSWPRDRFQWGSIISRYIMGIITVLLLLLNLGQYQEYEPPPDMPESERGIFLRWFDQGWVLPTIALAYAVQFVVDMVLVYLAVWFSRNGHETVSPRPQKM
ncbi:low temperature requirement protein LtrA [Ceratobasidium sp. AG-Ba]|nr:low temperature requirement protein LtrA [Ceratobasidium sp. AG-Ba]